MKMIGHYYKHVQGQFWAHFCGARPFFCNKLPTGTQKNLIAYKFTENRLAALSD
jgi:hypothetical protein